MPRPESFGTRPGQVITIGVNNKRSDIGDFSSQTIRLYTIQRIPSYRPVTHSCAWAIVEGLR